MSPAEYKDWEKRMMLDHGWYCHMVGGDPDSPTGSNIHTHGLPESFNHPDLQLVLPLPGPTANAILANVVQRIKQGEAFCDGDYAENIIRNHSVKFVAAKESGRELIRVVMPDPEGNLESWSQNEQYVQQYADLP